MFATTVLLGMEPAPHGRSPWSLVFGAQGLALELEDAQCLLLHFVGLHAQPLALANSCFLHIVRGTPAGPRESLVEHIKQEEFSPVGQCKVPRKQPVAKTQWQGLTSQLERETAHQPVCGPGATLGVCS